MSMKPGATTLPAASIVLLRGAAARLPMAATFPSRMPRSPEYQGDPVPSMMWPLVMTRSNAGGVCPLNGHAVISAITRMSLRHRRKLASMNSALFWSRFKCLRDLRGTSSRSLRFSLQNLTQSSRRTSAEDPEKTSTPKCIRAPPVRDRTYCDPDTQRQPFVHGEMPGNGRNDFHQQHRDGYKQPKAGSKPFNCRQLRLSRQHSCAAHVEIGGTGRGPS